MPQIVCMRFMCVVHVCYLLCSVCVRGNECHRRYEMGYVSLLRTGLSHLACSLWERECVLKEIRLNGEDSKRLVKRKRKG